MDKFLAHTAQSASSTIEGGNYFNYSAYSEEKFSKSTWFVWDNSTKMDVVFGNKLPST